MSPLEQLRERLAELADIDAIARLAGWDQRVTMPGGGGEARAGHVATLARIRHERSTSAELGEWLQALDGADLGEVDADMLRIARRDWERAQRIPRELAADLAEAAAAGEDAWERAREQDDFKAFAPALERNVELARTQGELLAEPGQSAYDGLLGEFDYGLQAAQLRELFSRLAQELSPLVAEAEAHSPPQRLAVGVEAQEAAVRGVLTRLGVDTVSWRVDVSAHPFTTWMAPLDTRLTTRYRDGDVESLLSSLHEYGHGLYERQVDLALQRTNLGEGTSMSVHESQSKLWENHVARSPAFAEVIAAELGRAGFPIGAPELHSSLVGVERSLIRVSADPLTYPLHIILRFELELALVQGDLAVADLPAAWSEKMRSLLGVEVPSDALGCMQDVHWSAGMFGYFPSYALGCLIAAQLWETIERDLGDLDARLRRAELEPVQAWLREHVHRFGRRVDTLPLVERATGAPLAVDAFVRYVEPLAGR